jgi:hypothetical protein
MSASQTSLALQQHAAQNSDLIQQYLDVAKIQFELQQKFLLEASTEAFQVAHPVEHVVVIDGRGSPDDITKKLAALKATQKVDRVFVDVNALKIYATIT